MAIAAPMATTDIPTVNGSVIMIISRLASGLVPATVTPSMDWIITARIRTAHTPADYTVRPLLIDDNTSCPPVASMKRLLIGEIASNRR